MDQLRAAYGGDRSPGKVVCQRCKRSIVMVDVVGRGPVAFDTEVIEVSSYPAPRVNGRHLTKIGSARRVHAESCLQYAAAAEKAEKHATWRRQMAADARAEGAASVVAPRKMSARERLREAASKVGPVGKPARGARKPARAGKR